MRRLLRGADLTVGNLESTLSTDGEPQQPNNDSFGGSPALVPVLEDAGFDALSLANNHTGDYGERALRQTVATLRKSRIRAVRGGRRPGRGRRAGRAHGAGRDDVRLPRLQRDRRDPDGDREQPGRTVGADAAAHRPANTEDLRRVTSAVRRAQREADVVVVLPHWGTQYTHLPEPVQRTVARRLVAAGADLVVGGHPHWVQGADVVDGVPVLHSLGNFVFDMDRIPDPGAAT